MTQQTHRRARRAMLGPPSTRAQEIIASAPTLDSSFGGAITASADDEHVIVSVPADRAPEVIRELNASAEAQRRQARHGQVEEVIAAAVGDGRLVGTEAGTSGWRERLHKDFDGAKAQVEGLAAVPGLNTGRRLAASAPSGPGLSSDDDAVHREYVRTHHPRAAEAAGYETERRPGDAAHEAYLANYFPAAVRGRDGGVRVHRDTT